MAERVAVIGAGQMGNGIAHVFAQSGYDVTMIDVSANALERGKATIAGRFSDFRLYGAAMYYLVADAVGGPYVETGLDVVRASGSILPLSWPVMPHLAFGTNGRLSETTGWDVNFSATVNGVLSLDAGYLF